MTTAEQLKLDQEFEKAVERATKTDRRFPPDTRLYFYAYYKRANGNHSDRRDIEDIEGGALINAFKMNAIFQAKNLTVNEAKRRYVELVNKCIPNK